MIGIGTPISQRRIPRPILHSLITKLYDPTRPCGSGSRRNAWNFITQLRFFRRAECGQAQRENDMSNITEFETGSLDVVGVSGGGNASAVSWGAIIAGAVAAAASTI